MSVYAQFQLHRIQQLSFSTTALVWAGARTQPLAFFHKLERQPVRRRGTLDGGWGGAAGRDEAGPVAWNPQGTREEAAHQAL